jgi:hypothetical protein
LLRSFAALSIQPSKTTKKYDVCVLYNNWSTAKQDRLYKPLSVGARARIMFQKLLKPKPLIQHGLRIYIGLYVKMVMNILLMKITEERYTLDMNEGQ